MVASKDDNFHKIPLQSFDRNVALRRVTANSSVMRSFFLLTHAQHHPSMAAPGTMMAACCSHARRGSLEVLSCSLPARTSVPARRRARSVVLATRPHACPLASAACSCFPCLGERGVGRWPELPRPGAKGPSPRATTTQQRTPSPMAARTTAFDGRPRQRSRPLAGP